MIKSQVRRRLLHQKSSGLIRKSFSFATYNTQKTIYMWFSNTFFYPSITKICNNYSTKLILEKINFSQLSSNPAAIPDRSSGLWRRPSTERQPPRRPGRLVSYPHTTRCHNPEDLDLNLDRRESINSRICCSRLCDCFNCWTTQFSKEPFM